MAYQSLVNSLTTLLVVLVLVNDSYQTERSTYEGYAVYRCHTQSSHHVDHLRRLMSEKRGEGVEFWTEPSDLNTSVDIMASPDEQDWLRNHLRVSRIPCRTIMHDVGEVIRRTSRINGPYPQLPRTYRTNTSMERQQYLLGPEVFYSGFQPYSVMEQKLSEFAKDPLVTLDVAGLSYENRRLYLVKFSKDPAAKKPVIFLDAGHHAREWISHSTIFYLMESLISGKIQTLKNDFKYASSAYVNGTTNELTDYKLRLNRDLKTLLDDYDFWFLPVVNPDGYEHTHRYDRLWRKTRSGGSVCGGVDPNRNYPYHWREAGASANPCSDIYAGPKPLSEPETATLASILDNNKDRIVMYLTLHAYSQLFLVPYGYGKVKPDNYEELERVAKAGIEAIAAVRGTFYQFGTSSIVLYPAAGGSDDYALGQANIKLSYTIELPDKGEYGFLIPPKEILPIGEETSIGIASMIEAM